MKNDQQLIEESIKILNSGRATSLNHFLTFREIIVRFEKTLAENRVLIRKIETQSKSVIMGEMIDAIAHQWTQPIGVISLYAKMVVDDFQYGDVDQKYLDNFSVKVDFQVNHLLNTLTEFRNFLRPSSEITEFLISKAISNCLTLLEDLLKDAQIIINIDIKDGIKLLGSKIEFEHIILNLVNNSKDAFVENGIKNREIDITIYENRRSIICEVQDNAGGIPEHILENVFDLNFTTKDVGKGTGVGLYMTQRMINKVNGSIEVENMSGGALFTILFPKS